MTELLEKGQAEEMFMRRGHLFHPGQLQGFGEVTVLYIGTDVYYTAGTVAQFCKRLIKACHMDEQLIRRFAYETLGQRKHPPLLLHPGLILVSFPYPVFGNPSHRTVYAYRSSIEAYRINQEPKTCTLLLKDGHSFLLSASRRQLTRQLRNAEHLRNRYVLRFPDFT
ncbi:competence protein ComK [Aneurinibacillus sp. BA2021]|nr:competence protein ComK [Aneurinibacillus sp. BA2021]